VINADGEWEKDVESSPLREEPDFDAIAEWERQEHEDQVHGGKPCNCPPPEPLFPEPPGGYSDEPPF
jgi:hypothetical protein